MSTQTSISVVITTCNRPRLLRTAIESVLAQTRPADQIIVVDSGDEFPANEVVASYPQVAYCRSPKAGPSVSRNIGLSEVNCDYVNFLDDDDWFLPEKLLTQSRILDERPEVDVSYCRLLRADYEGRIVGEYLLGHVPPNDPVLELLKDNFVLLHAALTRSNRVRALAGFDPNIKSAEDYDFWMRLALNGANFDFYPGILGVVRSTPYSQSSNRRTLLANVDRVFLKNSHLLKKYRSPLKKEWWRARPYFCIGLQLIDSGCAECARGYFETALSYSPLHLRALIYWSLTFLPTSILPMILSARSQIRGILSLCHRESRWG